VTGELGPCTSIKFLQAKAFYFGTVPITPVTVHWGMVSKAGDPLTNPTVATITYKATTGSPLKYNSAVNLCAPDDKLKAGYKLAYYFGAINPVYPSAPNPKPAYFTPTHYILKPALTKTGRIMHIPGGGGAGYPFSDWNYSVTIQNETHQTIEVLHGKPMSYFWGLTKQTKAAYQANNDLPWYNNAGLATLDGYEDKLVFLHDGGYKGTYLASTPMFWVPTGYNVLYKVKYAKYWNKSVVETPDSKAYFLPGP
jgi:hypothetical protein